MRRGIQFIMAILVMTGLLTGCGSQPFLPSDAQSTQLAPLPTIGPVMTQPPLSAGTQYVAAALYFPNQTRTRLVRSTQQVAVRSSQIRVKAIVSALLGTPEDSSLLPLFDQRVYARRVDLCRDLVTVDLSVGEADLDEQTIVVAAAALTTTLTQVSGISYVRLLFNGREMTERGVLMSPMTVPGQSLDILLLLHEKLVENPAASSRSNEILFFKDYSGQFLLCEVRSVAATGSPVEDILTELKKGPRNSGDMVITVPKTMILEEYAVDQDETGAQRLVLHFSYPKFETMDNKSLLLLLASLVESMCAAMPSLDGVQIYLNGVLQETVPAVGTVTGGLLNCDMFNDLMGNVVPLYFRDIDESLLVTVTRAMAQDQFNLPQNRIYELMRGPLESEAGEMAAIFPEGVTQADLLGVWVDSECMYLNFSYNFQSCCVEESVDERTLIYGIVNTMTEFYNVKKVQFLIEGKRVSSLSGMIDIGSPLLPNPGLVMK